MKKLILIILLFFCSISAEVFKLQADSMSMNMRRSDDEWSGWSPQERTDISIIINTGTKRIFIDKKLTQGFDILEDTRSKDRKGNEVLILKCSDSEDKLCYIKLFIKKKNEYQMYIIYSDCMYSYNTKVNNEAFNRNK